MGKVVVIISKGFEEIEAISIIDILRRAGLEVTVASINELLTTGANGITIKANIKLKELEDKNSFDMVVLPGGVENTENLASNTLVKDILNDMKNKDKYIGAICAAPYALHEAGVLNNNYTCYPSFENKIRDNGYQGDKQEVVIDGKVVTSRGPATAMSFALELVKILKGEETYKNVSNGLLIKDVK